MMKYYNELSQVKLIETIKRDAEKAGLSSKAIHNISGYSTIVRAAQDLLNSGFSLSMLMSRGAGQSQRLQCGTLKFILK